MEVFYFDSVSEGIINLPEEESKHITKVLRKQVGDIVFVTDGKGNLFRAELITVGKYCSANCVFDSVKTPKRDYYLHLAVAPTKMMERYEWMIEKSMEIGVDEITPILCEHSERKIVKEERLLNIAVSAMKQSKNLYLPKINNLTKFSDFIKNNFEGNKCIAYCENDGFEYFFDTISGGANTLLVGPEGDFSKEEVVQACAVGFKPVSLGNTILRVETAAVAASMMVAIKNFNAGKI